MNKYISVLLLIFSSHSIAQQSTCFGTTSNGYIENAVKLPADGDNFVGYSTVARIAGRTYVHSKVNDIVVDAYHWLETEQPDKVYKYAETGFAEGGQFKPHKTHRNGLSVDFMTPVVDASGESVHLPTHPFNKFGYEIEFDSNDRYEDYQIDYDALAAHIVALHKSAKKHGVDLWRVIFDPQLQPKLLATNYGDYLKAHIQFSTKRSWVRHDEHYHVDFAIACQDINK
ncbi:penicillin-insensitive murein endopeptidase [Thalassotalea sp. PS06]|uniref:penicillin-insensitive murein endopeptidase n=1 Tax=Thalassotalea sp. PS06 TaxID=2594005 RepID=UPI0011629782|nr:penicillin-insensitive murein endopeptidase [Thalassotalea sp. PS06]QDO99936.1 replication initiation protein [Thalassotalea sp. PS06]